MAETHLQNLLEDYHTGRSVRAYEFLGCHRQTRDQTPGHVFRVWAPNAQGVNLVGDFNRWNDSDLPMQKISRGVWECWTPLAREGNAYKFLIRHWDGRVVYKADPVGFRTCRAPDTSSVIWQPRHKWGDGRWFENGRFPLNRPLNIYELHLGSWRRREDGSIRSYGEIAPELAEYLKNMHYTHVELLPLGEHQAYEDLGYQVTGFYAPTSRYGSPDELMVLVDTLHQAGIGVILDWVAGHFSRAEWGLARFDGTCAYELPDPAAPEGESSGIFNFGRPEVKSFLVSNAVYWLETFHLDGLRVEGGSAMLWLDYGGRRFVPNRYGGRENLEAIGFLRELNRACFAVRPNAIMVAEESTAFPLVTKPDFDGGLGFLFKWDGSWTDCTLAHFRRDLPPEGTGPGSLTFPMTYALAENFILPLSHDAVANGKDSLIGQMPGEYPRKFAELRLLRGYQMACPGKKLCFMGGEFGQFIRWNCCQGLDWMLLDYDTHRKTLAFTRDLNRFYLEHRALWGNDHSPGGFRWILPEAGEDGILAFCRTDGETLVVICNFTRTLRESCRLGVPQAGVWQPVLCSDDGWYGGTGAGAAQAVSEQVPFRDFADSALFRVPPLSVTFYRWAGTAEGE